MWSECFNRRSTAPVQANGSWAGKVHGCLADPISNEFGPGACTKGPNPYFNVDYLNSLILHYLFNVGWTQFAQVSPQFSFQPAHFRLRFFIHHKFSISTYCVDQFNPNFCLYNVIDHTLIIGFITYQTNKYFI